MYVCVQVFVCVCVCMDKTNFLRVEHEVAIASHSLGPHTEPSLSWFLLIARGAGPNGLMVVEEVGQVIWNQVLSRNTQVHWIPVAELPPQGTGKERKKRQMKHCIKILTPRANSSDCRGMSVNGNSPPKKT